MIYVEMLSLNTDKKNLPIAVTMGDPSGINSEIILKAFNKISNNKKIDFFIICDPSWIKKSKKIFNINVPLNVISKEINIKQNKLNILPIKNKVFSNLGHPDRRNNKAIMESLNTSINLAKNNKVCGIVTLPIYKKNLMESNSGFIGHTEYLAEKDNNDLRALSWSVLQSLLDKTKDKEQLAESEMDASAFYLFALKEFAKIHTSFHELREAMGVRRSAVTPQPAGNAASSTSGSRPSSLLQHRPKAASTEDMRTLEQKLVECVSHEHEA